MNAAAALLGLSRQTVQSIMDRAVARGLERREATHIPRLGIDEKSFTKGHDYITVLTDVDGSRVLDVVPERTQAGSAPSGTTALASSSNVDGSTSSPSYPATEIPEEFL